VPKGTSIEVRVVTPFDSNRAAKGKPFQAAVLRPLYVGGHLVGTSGEDREDLADEWAASGLGPSIVAVARGTVLAMRLDNALTSPPRPGLRRPGTGTSSSPPTRCGARSRP